MLWLAVAVDLSPEQQAELRALINRAEVPAVVGTRARIVLWHAEGRRKKDIAALAGVSRPTVDLWLGRYAAGGASGLLGQQPGAPREQVPADVRSRVLALTRTTPPVDTGLSHWSSRLMAALSWETAPPPPVGYCNGTSPHPMWSGPSTTSGSRTSGSSTSPRWPARRDASDRTALPIAGDDTVAKRTVVEFLDSIGYDTVDVGPLAENWRTQRDTPVYVTVYGTFDDTAGTPADAQTVREAVAAARPTTTV